RHHRQDPEEPDGPRRGAAGSNPAPQSAVQAMDAQAQARGSLDQGNEAGSPRRSGAGRHRLHHPRAGSSHQALHRLRSGRQMARGQGCPAGDGRRRQPVPRQGPRRDAVPRQRHPGRRRVGVQGRVRGGLPGQRSRPLRAAPKVPAAQRRGRTLQRRLAIRVLRRLRSASQRRGLEPYPRQLPAPLQPPPTARRTCRHDPSQLPRQAPGLTDPAVSHVLSPDTGFLISNFTANIALPGSQSMQPHSDQSIVVPEPWLQPWSINIIWCLNDVRAANGATLYLPMSHQIAWAKDAPSDLRLGMRPFEAPAGSIIAMDGRLWHTSGANVTEREERALLFGYYSRDFIRPQTNWNASLSPQTIASLGPRMHAWLGLGPTANISLAAPLAIPS